MMKNNSELLNNFGNFVNRCTTIFLWSIGLSLIVASCVYTRIYSLSYWLQCLAFRLPWAY